MQPVGDFVTAFAPVARLGKFEGISIVVSTVEMWTSHFLVALVAERNELIERLAAERRAAWDQYELDLLAHRTDRQTQRPHAPPVAEIQMSRAPLVVHDNVETDYRVNGIATGGSGNEWRSQWRFEPGAAPNATHLEISLDLDGTEPLMLPLR